VSIKRSVWLPKGLDKNGSSSFLFPACDRIANKIFRERKSFKCSNNKNFPFIHSFTAFLAISRRVATGKSDKEQQQQQPIKDSSTPGSAEVRRE